MYPINFPNTIFKIWQYHSLSLIFLGILLTYGYDGFRNQVLYDKRYLIG